ncbi:MAG: HIT family protein [Proteobacteria bacterium]|nr:HIT family protein [Pseudomonadota bacterium]MDA1331761.1 HIT family protein [Pseudomonadota bacterium]
MTNAACLFCDLQASDRERIVSENHLAYAVRDGSPVTEKHTLFIPKRHTLDFFGLVPGEILAINELIHEQRQMLLDSDRRIEGFNIGINCGQVAGQSVWHCHVHLIPRRKGDSEFPKGGVRHVIPYKGDLEDLR